MLIDKSKFTVLVAAIAASTAGCIINNADGAGGAGGGSTTGSTGGSTSQGGGGTGGATSSQGGSGTGGDTSQGGGGGGAACLGDTGTPDACSSECESVLDNCTSIPSLKPGVAVQVVTCLNALDASTCSAELDGWGGCFQGGLAAACHDPAVEATCTSLATSCTITDDAAWQTECSSYLSGMSTSGRDLTTQCFTDNCANSATLQFCTSYAYYL